MSASDYRVTDTLWFLEGFADASRRLCRVPILTLPFRVGRRPGLDLTLVAPEISQLHAEIDLADGRPQVRDLGSTNGTYVNQARLDDGPQRLVEGDILHFGTLEFRFGRLDHGEAQSFLASTVAIDTQLPQLMVDKGRVLQRLMAERSVSSVFQPIVRLSDRRPLGFEVLGRGDVEGLPAGSAELFKAAAVLGAEAELSRMFRAQCAPECASLAGRYTIFINTHPSEVGSRELEASVGDFRRRTPGLDLVLEIHERAVVDAAMICDLKAWLAELEIGLAFDDFGAGEARLVEITETVPDYLKFDISLIRGLDSASPGRRRMLESLVGLAHELDIAPIAEGVETAGEAELCARLGFVYGQGFLFARPAPLVELAGA